MTNSRIFIIILVLLVVGSAMAVSSANKPPPVSPPSQTSPYKMPVFKFMPNLPIMFRLRIWPSATPTPTVIASPTPTATPTFTPTPTTPPLTNTPPPNPLTPSPTDTPGGACGWMDNGLPNVNEFYPNGSTAMPSTTKEICAWISGQYYALPFRNRSCEATQAGINRAYERMKTYYPYLWQNSKLLDDWQTVQHYSRKYNFNPLFVISLWIEESAASGSTIATKLGCDNRRNKDDSYTKMTPDSTICEEMECLFGLQSANPANYAQWACNYGPGGGYWRGTYCEQVTTFTRGVEFWYNYIGESLPSGCQIRYFNGSDPRCP